jgi:hypothetical protein
MHTNLRANYVYLAIRLSSDGYEWADVTTASGNPDTVRQKARATDTAIPHWARANQFQRIARFDLVEHR